MGVKKDESGGKGLQGHMVVGLLDLDGRTLHPVQAPLLLWKL